MERFMKYLTGKDRSTQQKAVPKDPFPKSSEFNAEHYAILVAHPTPFHKYTEPFLCLVGISRYYTLDGDTYPEFLRDGDEGGCLVGERRRADGETPTAFGTTDKDVLFPPYQLHRIVPSGELEAVLTNFLTMRGVVSSGAGDSTGGGQGVDIQPVYSAAANTIVEDVAPLQPMRQKKRKTVVVD
ncbi:hypothetical protein Tco_0503742 [Tanacetum coccineum]